MQFFGLFGEHLSQWKYSERIHSTFFDLIGMNAGYKHIELSPIELSKQRRNPRALVRRRQCDDSLQTDGDALLDEITPKRRASKAST